MKILRTAALFGIGKKVYDEARKPHNQAKIRETLDKVKNKRGSSGPNAPR